MDGIPETLETRNRQSGGWLVLLCVDQERRLRPGRPKSRQVPPLEIADWYSIEVSPKVEVLHSVERLVPDVEAAGHHDALQCGVEREE